MGLILFWFNGVNALTISAKELEERVLNGLRDQLLAPDAVSEFIKEFHTELRRRKKRKLNDAMTPSENA